MSEENVEAVRRIYEQWAQGNFREGVELYDPDIVMVQSREFPESGTYLGVDGIRRYMTTFLDAWERVTIEAKELIEAGDSVAAEVVQRAVGKESGAAPTDFDYFQVWTFRGGLVIRLDMIRERDTALRAVGLTPG
jgi:ketosteroid isomerase-like protein